MDLSALNADGAGARRAGQGDPRRRREQRHDQEAVRLDRRRVDRGPTAAPTARCCSRPTGAADYISGVILFDETIRQKAVRRHARSSKMLEEQGIIPGIKVDKGADAARRSPKARLVTEGLDGLRERLVEYRELGAEFAKWRAVIDIGDGIPSQYCIDVNAHALARYAALCQDEGIVPIVEPEVLMDGDHSIERCYEVTTHDAAHGVRRAAASSACELEGMLLKPNMVIPGKKHAGGKASPEAGRRRDGPRASATRVPAAVPGIVFLSGGQGDEEATANLDAINKQGPLPWQVSFSYGRALQARGARRRGRARTPTPAPARRRTCTGPG